MEVTVWHLNLMARVRLEQGQEQADREVIVRAQDLRHVQETDEGVGWETVEAAVPM